MTGPKVGRAPQNVDAAIEKLTGVLRAMEGAVARGFYKMARRTAWQFEAMTLRMIARRAPWWSAWWYRQEAFALDRQVDGTWLAPDELV